MASSRANRAACLAVMAVAVAFGASGVTPVAASAQEAPAVPAPPAVTYADLVTLGEAAGNVVLLAIKDQAAVEPARSPGLAAGQVRLYLEAETEALLAGRAALGEELVFLADFPLAANGRPPKLKDQRFIVFANAVAGRANSLQLVQPDSLLPADPATEQRVRHVIGQLATPDGPPRILGVREVISVPGNLAGESETQMFLETQNRQPVSLNVIRRPGMDPQWGVSLSEIVDQSAQAPEAETLQWYRLACALPRALPDEAFLQPDGPSRAQAEADYAFILEQLGPCARTRSDR